jgi:rhamnulokinase
MSEIASFAAVDLGASGGRVVLGQFDGARWHLDELHRFANRPVSLAGHLHTDVLSLWAEVKTGLARYAAGFDSPLAGIGVDTWGVDFGLLDAAGHLIGNPYNYRDQRTDGMVERACQLVPSRRIFHETGVQFMQLNTLYQLLSMTEANDPHLEIADTLLMLPDLFHYWLSGRKASESTNASTTQMLDCRRGSWSTGLLADLGILTHMLPPVLAPGTVLGEVQPMVMEEVGLRQTVPVVAPGSHDTASAVAAVPDLGSADMYISSGTWSLVGVELEEPLLDDRVLSLNFGNERGVADTIRLLRNVTGMWLLQESRRQWAREGHKFSWEQLLSLAGQAGAFRSLIDPDAAPFRKPWDMPSAIRTYCRNSGQPEPATVGEVVRCCLESIALRYRQVLDALESLTHRRLEVIRIVGGGSQNHLLCQLTADFCQRPVVAGPVEATALGNLTLQAIATGHVADISAGRQAVAASVARQWYEPGPGADPEEALQRFRGLRNDDAEGV